MWNVIAGGFFTLHCLQKLHISLTLKTFTLSDLSNRRMKSSFRTKITTPCSLGPSGLVDFRLWDSTVSTIDLQMLTDLNQGLCSETVFIFKHFCCTYTFTCIYLLLEINNNVHCSNSNRINIVLLALKDAYNVERSVFYVLSFHWGLLFLYCLHVNTVTLH